MAYEGYVDFADRREIRGWVFDDAAANTALTVEILSADRVIATIAADGYRKDLQDAGKGNGRHAFKYHTGREVSEKKLSARIAGRRWRIPQASPPPVSPRYLATLAHTLEFGHPDAVYDFSEPVAPPDERRIVERLIESWHRATNDDPQSSRLGDMWAELGRIYHREIVGLLRSRDVAGVSEYLRSAHAGGITFGITQGDESTKTLRQEPQARLTVVTHFVDHLVSLAESLGLLDLESPDQHGQWGENLHVDPEILVERISQAVGFSIVPPQGIGSLFGIRISAGVLCGRDFLALYAALRLRSIAAEASIDRPAVCEIGGGLGGVAYYATRLGVGSYTIIDLPLINVLQGYYLLRALPDLPIRLYGEPESSPAAIRLMPTWCFARDEPRYDLLLNQDSMPEMHADYSLGYLRQARRNVRHAFLSINQEARAPQNREARQTVVRDLVAQAGGFRRVYRFRHWLRAGYVEELYRIAPA